MTWFGLLLPHFGGTVEPARMLDGAQLAEELGFHSVWARDHLVYEPHRFEPGDATFLETFTTLSFVAARTRRLTVGTAVAIPTRHPIHLAQVAASLAQLAGQDRLLLGMGAGGSDIEFEVAGLKGVPRVDLVREQVDLCRRLWAGQRVTHQGTAHPFSDVSLRPPPGGRIPLLYGGSTPAAARLAAELFDGWLPGRITLATLERRLPQLHETFRARKQRPIVGMVPVTSIGESREDAHRLLGLPDLLENANRQRFWVRPSSGTFTSAEDLAGSVLAGDPEDVVRQARACLALGLDLIVFDLRMRFEQWEEQIRLLGTEVLPALS